MKLSANIPSLRTVVSLNGTGVQSERSMQRLSTGLRINQSRDNPAMHSITSRMMNQRDGLQQAAQNSMNAISIVQTAEGAMTEIHAMLQRQRELMVQALNGTYGDADRDLMIQEVDQMNDAIDMIARSTHFNRINLLAQEGFRTDGIWLGDGTDHLHPSFRPSSLLVQTGADMDQNFRISLVDVRSQALGLRDLDFQDVDTMRTSLDMLDTAIERVAEVRATFGAYQNRLEHNFLSLTSADENMQESLSRIRDTDMAREMTELSRLRVMEQAGISILAQSNMRPQQLLQLLQS